MAEVTTHIVLLYIISINLDYIWILDMYIYVYFKTIVLRFEVVGWKSIRMISTELFKVERICVSFCWCFWLHKWKLPDPLCRSDSSKVLPAIRCRRLQLVCDHWELVSLECACLIFVSAKHHMSSGRRWVGVGLPPMTYEFVSRVSAGL